MSGSVASIFNLLRLGDSAFPIGQFAFSNGLESAADTGLVVDIDQLGRYIDSVVRNAALSDAVAGLCAFDGCANADKNRIIEADNAVVAGKLGTEMLNMTLRTGRKMAELCAATILSEQTVWWHESIANGSAHGTLPATQGVVFAALHLDREQLFATHLYGTAGTVLGAALRTIRVSHIQTQRLLSRIGELAEELYATASTMGLEQMNRFEPQTEITASLHQKGTKRMFMN